jgi:hypothetical protein
MNEIASIVLHHVPYFHTVRVIYSEDVKSTKKDDGLAEFNIVDVLHDPNLQPIKDTLDLTCGHFNE